MSLPIVAERLVLRRYTHGDIPDVLGLASHPSFARLISQDTQVTEAVVREYVDQQISYQPFEMEKVFELAVERKEDGKVIGLVGMIRREQRQAEVGWGLGIEYRSQGYATEAASALMDYGFGSLGLHRIYADTSSDNIASLRVMERLGMRREGVLRAKVYKEGKWLDEHIYGMLADEWYDTDHRKL